MFRTSFIFVLLIISASFNSCGKNGTTIGQSRENGAVIKSKNGTHVFIDCTEESLISEMATRDDFLIATHEHTDHYNPALFDEFPGTTILSKAGVWETEDLKITIIPSSHGNAMGGMGEDFVDENGSNYIVLLEVDDLRIAHFGGIGQDDFTEEQLDILGHIDIAYHPVESRSSAMNMNNMKGFQLLEQLNPGFVIPTHSGERSIEYICTERNTLYGTEDFYVINKKDIPLEMTFLLIDMTSSAYASIYGLEEF